MSPARPPDIRTRFRFLVRPQYEVLSALTHVSGRAAPALAAWCDTRRADLPARFWESYRRLSVSPALWYGLFDLPASMALDPDYATTLDRIEAETPERLAQTILLGLIHKREQVDALMAGTPLPEVIAALPASRRDWLAFVGLYPPPRLADGPSFLEILAREPKIAQRRLLIMLASFWHSFKSTWRRLEPRLAYSAEEAQARIRYLPFEEISRRLGVNVEFDGKTRAVRSHRANWQIKFKHIDEIVMCPSIFNLDKIWCADDCRSERAILYFPYLDPILSPGELIGVDGSEPATSISAAIDPAMVFRALGDATRFAIATLIAKRARNAGEIAKELQIGKSTVAHHIHLLRQAGLIEERPQGNATLLSLNREAIAGLSARAVERLFDASISPVLARSRRSAVDQQLG